MLKVYNIATIALASYHPTHKDWKVPNYNKYTGIALPTRKNETMLLVTPRLVIYKKKVDNKIYPSNTK